LTELTGSWTASLPARSPSRIRRRLVLSGILLLAGLAGSEVLVRALVPRRTPPTESGPRLVQPSSDPRIGFENRPGARQAIRFFDSKGGVAKEVDTVINADGYRGPLVLKEKPKGTLRIAALGDSQTFGIGIGEGESWPAVLEASLEERLPGTAIEVMNCAVPGYNAEQEAAALESRWLAYAPDLVLLGYFANDPPPSRTLPDEGKSWSRWMLGELLPGQPGFAGWVRRNSALVDVVLDGVYRRLLVREWAAGAIQLHDDASEGWQRTRELIALERDACARAGARFAVVLIPFLVRSGRSGDGLISTRPYRKVSATCAAAGIPALDLEPCFEGVDLAGMLVHERDSHSSATAHRIEGDAIARWVLEEKLLPGR
jgi:lysophospholipase L1-like esterase